LGPIPNPQSPIPNPQSPLSNNLNLYNFKFIIKNNLIELLIRAKYLNKNKEI